MRWVFLSYYNPRVIKSLRGVGFHTLAKEKYMLYWALVFLVIALIAGLLGLGGVAIISAEIAKILFIIFLVLAVISLVVNFTRRGPTV